jgi:hypothetical protein
MDLTLRCPTCGQRADMCFDHGDDWKKRGRPEQEVARAAARADKARAELETAIREARRTLPLRIIARAAGMSHESVRKIAGEA